MSEDQTFPEREEELAPGDEITGNLVYTDSIFQDYDLLYLTFEAEAIDDETRFEIPIPSEELIRTAKQQIKRRNTTCQTHWIHTI
ncbi:hypothetical protein [Gracilibacillus phocaeensis]|uniref:hypothetical protein n=1 Tax=Gracilibacillus phocaeensis TaxID=2042304 RepID=UPI00103183C4|nr:hypothetical protein [Gracilibacillus phocaeensis]